MVLLRRNPFYNFIQSVGRPYGTLLVVLVLVILLYPFLGIQKSIAWMLDLVMLGVIMAAIRVIKGSGRAYFWICLLGVSAVLASLIGRTMQVNSAFQMGTGLRSLFMWYMLIVIFRDTMQARKVSFDTILGASCAYILLGLAFASVFSLVEWLQPGSFNIPPMPKDIATFWGNGTKDLSLTYFSIVTMSTLGYGDITPVSPFARNLAVLESMLGQLYLTIVIARMVGIEVADRFNQPSPNSTTPANTSEEDSL